MSPQGQTYASFLKAELAAERERRSTLDGRGLGLITTSGTLTTVLTGVAALVTSQDGFRLPGDVLVPLTVTLALFALASATGLLVTHNRQYEVAGPALLAEMLGSLWSRSEVDARNLVGHVHARTIASLRAGNDDKARLLMVGLSLQLVGLVALAVVLLLVLRAAP